MIDAKRGNWRERIWWVLKGQLACCHCGHWASRSSARRSVTRRRRRWYCGACGAYLEKIPTSFLPAFLLVFLVLVVSFPFVAALAWLLENLGFKYEYAISYVWFFMSVVIVFLIPAFDPNYFVTRCVEQHGECPSCDYDLNHAPHERCPECGTDARDVIVAIRKWKAQEQKGVLND